MTYERKSLNHFDDSYKFSLQEIEHHRCNKVAPRVFDCPKCDRTFPHQKSLDVHISNGWCNLGTKKSGFERVTDESECARRFKVLTGKEPNFVMLPVKKKKEVVVSDHETASSSSAAAKKTIKFNVSDRQILSKYNILSPKSIDESKVNPIEDLPETGNIFCGTKARGVNNEIRKEIKESGRSWKIRGKDGAAENEILRAGTNFFLDSKFVVLSQHQSDMEVNSDSDRGKREDEENLDPKSVAEPTTTEIDSPVRVKSVDKKSSIKKLNVSVKVLMNLFSNFTS